MFEKIAEAGIPLLAVDTASEFAINNTTSDNTALGTELADQLVADIGEAGNCLFNGFYGINVCALRYDALAAVLDQYPDVEILQPELQDVIPNTQEDARKKTQDLLQKYPEGEMSAVWACWTSPAWAPTSPSSTPAARATSALRRRRRPHGPRGHGPGRPGHQGHRQPAAGPDR